MVRMKKKIELYDVTQTIRKSGAEEIITSLNEPKRFSDIMRELGLAPSTLSRRLKEFLDKELVEIIYDSKERAEKYKLTSKGETYFKVMQDLHRGYEDVLAEKLSPEKRFEEKIEAIIEELGKHSDLPHEEIREIFDRHLRNRSAMPEKERES